MSKTEERVISTSTEWRDDEKNLELVKEINKASARVPFSLQYDGVLDGSPIEIEWTVWPNLPVAWKGGVAGVFGDEIALVGGMWIPGRENLAYSYNIKTQEYTPIPPPPVQPQYTQGAYDGEHLYVVGGRASSRNVFRLAKSSNGDWEWSNFTSLPESEEAGEWDGRWLSLADIVPGKWMLMCTGNKKKPDNATEEPIVGALRIRLDDPEAEWEPMAPYPGGKRVVASGAVVGGKYYVFGGWEPDEELSYMAKRVYETYKFNLFFSSVIDRRDAYCYDPESDQWSPIRSLPFPMMGGKGVALDDRYILILGCSHKMSFRIGKSMQQKLENIALYYGDPILCYDTRLDKYYYVGVMPYGVATVHWVLTGGKLYGFGGEPNHVYNENTENVFQIGTICWKNQI